MSQLSSTIFGFAAAAALGVASFQIASGEAFGFSGSSLTSASAIVVGVNRAAKVDRAPVKAEAGKGTTLVYQLSTLPSISFATRYAPVPRNTPPAAVGAARKLAACEGVVSVLTDIAEQLAPGRCVT